MATLILFLLILLLGTLSFTKYKKITVGIISLTICYFLIIGTGLLPSILLNHLQSYSVLKNPAWGKRNLIIFLGAGINKEKVSNTIQPSFVSYSRIYETARLYFSCQKTKNLCMILISGGDVKKIGSSEASVYANALNELGINNSNILQESKSLNTYQNAQFTSELLKTKLFDNIFLVTSSYHLTRALLYFSNFGLHPIPAPADVIKVYFSLVPLGNNFAFCDLALHEYQGMMQFYYLHPRTS